MSRLMTKAAGGPVWPDESRAIMRFCDGAWRWSEPFVINPDTLRLVQALALAPMRSRRGPGPSGPPQERRPGPWASSAGEGQPPLRGGQGAAPLRARCGAGDLQPLGRPLRPARVRPARGPATGEAGKVLAFMPRVPERLALAVPASGRAPGRPVRGRPNGAGRAPEVCRRLFPSFRHNLSIHV